MIVLNLKKMNKDMLSLYDYLGQKAGKKLGLLVGKLAAQYDVLTHTRKVTTKTWNGEINLYPRQFLQDCFYSNDKVRLEYQRIKSTKKR